MAAPVHSIPASKACSKCGETKLAAEFYLAPSMRSGLNSHCKACRRAATGRYFRENKEACLEKLRLKNRETYKPGQKRSRQSPSRSRQTRTEYQRQYRAQHGERARARKAVMTAIANGTLTPKPCERCGFGLGVHAHHEDYSKPLDVNWLCQTCHGHRHREINDERRAMAA
jgi:hypothetical protein